ncbi:bifunctional riboflavin kinase/FAD synthetase [Chitinimonas koreensis]|uniref:bifunctional riboflavin kinase/FAD synthetase n=1 Tax=Chitinimonas koreensis TaxID=356302 RepID=UPI001653F1FC|nr:bifunctional riboflavin kinase/FAD synthetase [Chitinimonas koreensis]QNM98927.1 bifunctional riboflavin kinase/FAD synthetase [Chitinimonas koreensis]
MGNFDGLHRGHRAMLDRLVGEARRLGLPAAVLTFEPHPRELFAPAAAPARLSSLREKLELLREAGVERVYLAHFNHGFAGLTAEAFAEDVVARQIGARYVLVGDDFRFGRGRAGDQALLAELGHRAGFLAEAMPEIAVDGQRASSTAVREALATGHLALAGKLLGRPYRISGRVVHGNKLGREIGFPTANIQIKHNRPPLAGIFVTEVHGAGATPLLGAASLGKRPTVDDSGRYALEVFLLDFSGDLYGRHLQVDFLHKLRDEEKYDGLDALIAQIRLDVDHARAFYRERQHSERISRPRP